MGTDGEKKIELRHEIQDGIGEVITRLKQKRENLKDEELDSYLELLTKAAKLNKLMEVKPETVVTKSKKGEKELGYSSKKYLTKA